MRVKNFCFFILTTAVLVGSTLAQSSQRDQGIEQYRAGNFDKAIELLTSTVESDPKDRIAWVYLGASYVHTRQPEQAQKAFARTNIVQKENLPVYDKQVKITHKPHARYTDEARRNGSSGTIKIAVELRSDGEIGFVFPLENSIKDLEPSVVGAAKGIRFQPAIQNGVPVTVVLMLEYSFSTF